MEVSGNKTLLRDRKCIPKRKQTTSVVWSTVACRFDNRSRHVSKNACPRGNLDPNRQTPEFLAASGHKLTRRII